MINLIYLIKLIQFNLRWWRRSRWRDSCGCSPAVPETLRIPEIRLMEVPLLPRSPTRVHQLPVVMASCFRGEAALNFSEFQVRILRTCWMIWYEQLQFLMNILLVLKMQLRWCFQQQHLWFIWHKQWKIVRHSENWVNYTWNIVTKLYFSSHI